LFLVKICSHYYTVNNIIHIIFRSHDEWKISVIWNCIFGNISSSENVYIVKILLFQYNIIGLVHYSTELSWSYLFCSTHTHTQLYTNLIMSIKFNRGKYYNILLFVKYKQNNHCFDFFLNLEFIITFLLLFRTFQLEYYIV